MFPWSAVIGLAGTAASGIFSAINNRKAQKQADEEAARATAAAQARANEDTMARADVQQAVQQYDRQGKEQIENARNQATINGGTPEQVLAVQNSVAQGRADVISNAAADNAARRDKYLDEVELINRQKASDDQKRLAERNTTYANLAINAAKAAASLADSYSPESSRGKQTAEQKAQQKQAEVSSYADQEKQKRKSGQAVYQQPLFT